VSTITIAPFSIYVIPDTSKTETKYSAKFYKLFSYIIKTEHIPAQICLPYIYMYIYIYIYIQRRASLRSIVDRRGAHMHDKSEGATVFVPAEFHPLKYSANYRYHLL
jgi:hypothetical protein